MAAAAANEKDEKADAAGSDKNARGGGGMFILMEKLAPVLTIVNTLVVLGLAAILFVSFQREKKKPKIEDIIQNAGAAGEKGEGGSGEKAGESSASKQKKLIGFGKMVHLDPFTINLATPGSVNPKFVRVDIYLEAPTDDVESEINLKIPQIRNVIFDLFNSKKAADVVTVEGRDYIKEEIKNSINAFLLNGKIKTVVFTNFTISS